MLFTAVLGLSLAHNLITDPYAFYSLLGSVYSTLDLLLFLYAFYRLFGSVYSLQF